MILDAGNAPWPRHRAAVTCHYFPSSIVRLDAETMPTEVPYAADAEISLTYDELEVSRVGTTQMCSRLMSAHRPYACLSLPTVL